MQMKKLVVGFFLILALTVISAAGNGFDVHVERVADRLAGGGPATVVVSEHAPSLGAPVHWEIEVYVSTKRIFRFESKDTEIDSGFRAPGFVGGCSSYEDCKLRWYLGMANNVILEISEKTDPRIIDETWPGSMFTVTREYLVKKCGLDPEAATKIVKRIAGSLRHGGIKALSLPLTPATDGPLLIYVPEVKGFVPLREAEIQWGS